MQLRPFGKTDLRVSERGFGTYAIGGSAYGPVTADDALSALARAEDLGCNFIDSAAVYGEAESLLGRFFVGRRNRWILASKYSAQPEGMTATVERQLARLRTDRIDYYQIHWAPSVEEAALYAELERLKQAGKIRYAGVSLRLAADVARVLEHPVIDGLQMPVSLLDPVPLLPSLSLLRQRRPAVIARSALHSGFLAGGYQKASRFEHASDQRATWSRSKIARTAGRAAVFRFLQTGTHSLRETALAYPLSFPEVSTLIVSCKNARQTEENLGSTTVTLDAGTLQRIRSTQDRLGLVNPGTATRFARRIRKLILQR